MSLSLLDTPASPSEASTSTRTALRLACQAADPVLISTDPPQAGVAEPVRALLGGRWSVLDRFERDGRTYLVAVRTAGLVELTPRETQVVRLMALGHSNKSIAYELGLAWSTIRVLVHRAARKLHARTRRELERMARDVCPSATP
jgi:DNA-binding NarL/FixJ family response regulator